MKPRVLHISALQLGTGGTERIILQISHFLNTTYDFDLLSGASNEFNSQFLQHSGGNIYAWDVKRLIDLKAVVSLSRYLDLIKPDIVHLHDSRAGFLARHLLKINGIPSVLTAHLPPYYYQWKKFTNLRRYIYATIESLINHLTPTTIVYVATKSYENALQKNYAKKGQAYLINNGIDLFPYKNIPPNKKHHNPPLICSVARLTLQKNIALLIRSAEVLKKRGVEFELWVVGDGPERSSLEETVRKHNLIETIRFLGTRSDIVDILGQADIFVLPSLYEARPLAVLEAQAAGLPCVLSNVGDHSYLVNNPECGYIFDVNDEVGCADALEILLRSPVQREKFGGIAQKKAINEYAMSKMVQSYDQLYKTLLGN
jgi:glycosyltransferase involved in cell wall biosynthesis